MRSVAQVVRRLGRADSDLVELVLAQLGQRPVTAAVSFLVALALPPDERGRVAFVVGIAAIGASFAFGSMHVGAVLAVQACNRAAFRRAVVTTALVAGASAVAATAFVVYRPDGRGLYDWEAMTQVLVGVSATVPLLFTTRTVQGLGRATVYRRLVLGNVGLYAVGTLVLLYAVGWESPLAVTLPWIGANAVTALAGMWSLHNATAATPWSATPPDVAPVAASLSAHAGSAAQQLAYKADLFLLGWFASARDIGLYSLATSFAELVWVVPEVLVLWVFADPVVRRGENWRAVARRRIRQSLVASAVAGVLVTAVAGVATAFVLTAYGGSMPLLLLLLPGVVAASAARVTLSVLTARDQRRALRRAAMWMTAATAIYLPAIAWGGVTGAAVASSLIYLCQSLALRSLWRREVPARPPGRTAPGSPG